MAAFSMCAFNCIKMQIMYKYAKKCKKLQKSVAFGYCGWYYLDCQKKTLAERPLTKKTKENNNEEEIISNAAYRSNDWNIYISNDILRWLK